MCSPKGYLVIPNQIRFVGKTAFYDNREVKKYIILNPNCTVGEKCVPDGSIIYGFKDSITELMAKKEGINFKELVQKKS